MSSDAIAILGFVALFVLMLLRVPVGMAMGLVGVSGFAYIVGGPAGAEERRPHHHAHGDRLQLRGRSAVPADGSVRHHLGHEPRAVPRRQRLRRPPARRARHRDHRGLRRLRGDLRLVGRDRRHLLEGRLPGDAPLRLSAVVRHRRHRRRRHARHHDPALDGARGLRPDHRAGRRQAVHRRHPAGHPRGRHVHDHDHADRHGAAGLPAGRPARTPGGSGSPRCATSGRRCCCSPS